MKLSTSLVIGPVTLETLRSLEGRDYDAPADRPGVAQVSLGQSRQKVAESAVAAVLLALADLPADELSAALAAFARRRQSADSSVA